MTTTTVTTVHCDYAGCARRTPETEVDGWAVATYTHGCPEHAEVIATHAATLDCDTYRRKERWSLRCRCGWTPRRNHDTWSSRRLQADHLKHVAEVTGGGGS
jgi:hypothetical protein